MNRRQITLLAYPLLALAAAAQDPNIPQPTPPPPQPIIIPGSAGTPAGSPAVPTPRPTQLPGAVIVQPATRQASPTVFGDIESQLLLQNQRDRAGAVDPNSTPPYDWDNESLALVLRILASQARLNFIEPGIPTDERISLSLRNVTPREAFFRVAQARGFEVRMNDSSVVTIHRGDLGSAGFFSTVVYPLRNINATFVLGSAARLLGIDVQQPGANNPVLPAPNNSGAVGAGGGGGGAGAAGSGRGGNSGGSSGFDDQSRPRFTPAQPFDSPLSRGGWDEKGGKSGIYVDRDQNALVVRTNQEGHETISKFIRSKDVRQQKVLVEVRIVELLGQQGDNFGIDWSETFGENGARFTFTPSVTATNGSFSLLPNGGVLSYPTVTAVLRALEQNGKATSIDFSRQITASGMPVYIRSVREENVVLTTGFTGGTVIGGGGTTGPTTTGTTEIRPFFTGVTFDVVPVVLPNGSIELNLNPVVSTRVGTTQTVQGPIPIIDRRSATTLVTVPSGKTVAFGGLVREATENSANGVTGLSKIPLIGGLFRSKTTSKKRSNLVFFVTPQIVPDNFRENDPAVLEAMAASNQVKRSRELPDPKVVRAVTPTTTTTSTTTRRDRSKDSSR